MKHLLRTCVLLIACTSVTHAQVVINEARINDPGTDDFVYFELFNRGRSAVNLGAITYVVIGSGAGGSGVVVQALRLPSFSLAPNERFLASTEAMLRIDADADGIVDYTETPDFRTTLQFAAPGNATHLLAVGFSGAVNNDLDTDDDGILDARPWVAVLDAVSFYAPGNESWAYASDIAASFENVGPDGTSVPSHIFRAPDGGPWGVGNLGAEFNPGGGNLLQDSQDTPGRENPAVTPLSLTLSETSVSEGAANPALTGTVTRAGTSGEVEITVTIDDESEAIVTETVILAAGESSAVFNIEVVNDLYPDGAQTVTVTVSGPGFTSADESFEVTDDGDAYSVVVNEVYYANDPAGGDVNGDGLADVADHFVELVNVSAAPVDLSDYHLEEGSGTEFSPDGIHRFPVGTILEPGCALVVFGGAGVQTGTTAAFGTAEVQISSTGGLLLNVTGETLRLFNASGDELYNVDLPDTTAAQSSGSLGLVSAGAGGDPALGYDWHLNLSAGNALHSPGTDTGGDPFCTVTDELGITLLDGILLTPLASIPENASPGSVVARIAAPGRQAGEVVTFRLESARGDLIPSGDGIGMLDDANPTVDWPLDPVDNTLAQDARIETISVTASNYLNAEATIEVTDDGDLPPFIEVVINEVDADQTGTDTQEFVELYNLTGLERSLDGLVLVLINGNGDSVYQVTDLSGFTIPANGFFVIGHAEVPNVDFVPQVWSVQNGADAVAIYQGTAADFTIGAAVTSLSNTLIDAVVYGTNDADDAGLLAALTPGQAQVNEGGGAGSGTESIQRRPDGGTPLETSTFVTGTPTPGASNLGSPAGEEKLIDLDIDFGSNLVVATFSDLQPGISYSVEASSDGGQSDPFVRVTSFTIADRNVVNRGSRVFEVRLVDGFLGDLVTHPRQIYRLSKP